MTNQLFDKLIKTSQRSGCFSCARSMTFFLKRLRRGFSRHSSFI